MLLNVATAYGVVRASVPLEAGPVRLTLPPEVSVEPEPPPKVTVPQVSAPVPALTAFPLVLIEPVVTMLDEEMDPLNNAPHVMELVPQLIVPVLRADEQFIAPQEKELTPQLIVPVLETLVPEMAPALSAPQPTALVPAETAPQVIAPQAMVLVPIVKAPVRVNPARLMVPLFDILVQVKAPHDNDPQVMELVPELIVPALNKPAFALIRPEADIAPEPSSSVLFVVVTAP